MEKHVLEVQSETTGNPVEKKDLKQCHDYGAIEEIHSHWQLSIRFAQWKHQDYERLLKTKAKHNQQYNVMMTIYYFGSKYIAKSFNGLINIFFNYELDLYIELQAKSTFFDFFKPNISLTSQENTQ